MLWGILVFVTIPSLIFSAFPLLLLLPVLRVGFVSVRSVNRTLFTIWVTVVVVVVPVVVSVGNLHCGTDAGGFVVAPGLVVRGTVPCRVNAGGRAIVR